MAKKSLKDAAAQGASVFNVIAAGNTQTAQNAQDVQTVPAVQLERLNLKIPADVKAYLTAAAYRTSTPQHISSITEYLVNLVREDMAKHKGK